MTAKEIKRAVGTFPTRTEAREALLELQNAGFNMDNVSAIAQISENDPVSENVEIESVKDRTKGGAGVGATMGAATGGILGLVGSLSVLAIPGVGPAVEVGVLLGNALLGSGVGAAGGSIIGALIGWGIPEAEAEQYQDLLIRGSYIVLVEGTEAEVNGAEAILKNRRIRNWAVYSSTEVFPRGL
ncbi:hypothetical protein [Myxosarcina sp. GI1]|uniref:hypothetical protein n=1 Tax=Myxosarcina sp. GI1 TaxID=1541065 RepID=UPI000560BC11|nr:hypothetical protein [Myxosarcina sp. GI1]